MYANDQSVTGPGFGRFRVLRCRLEEVAIPPGCPVAGARAPQAPPRPPLGEHGESRKKAERVELQHVALVLQSDL